MGIFQKSVTFKVSKGQNYIELCDVLVLNRKEIWAIEVKSVDNDSILINRIKEAEEQCEKILKL